MSATQTISASGKPRGATGLPSAFSAGKMFVNIPFDYMLIGGGLSLAAALAVWLGSGRTSVDSVLPIGLLLLFSNYAHFAASTVRLYTKPGAFKAVPFLTTGFPLVTLVVLTLGIWLADSIGTHLTRLYLTWSPYHYSAQAYGLAVMYCYRSGCNLSPLHKRALWWSCMMTFLKTLISQPNLNSGIWWVAPWESVAGNPALVRALGASVHLLDALAIGVPAAALFWLRSRERLAIPLIVPLLIFTNALWFVAFSYFDALVAVTVFHGIQYIAIVTIFHVRDQKMLPGNRRGSLYHALTFYAMCFALGYALFRCWPSAYELAGFGYVESALVAVSIINIHHFIVDGFIWKLKSDPNYKIVADEAG